MTPTAPLPPAAAPAHAPATWVNEPAQWTDDGDRLAVVTDRETDFWRETWYGFTRFSGHFHGAAVAGDFTFQVRVQARFEALYDQAGVMLLADDRHWLKAGIEHNDGQPSIASVLTAGHSDWATGPFLGDPADFRLRVTRVGDAVRVQHSADGRTWPLLRLCRVDPTLAWRVGVMCCTPQRAGLAVTFSERQLGPANGRDLHDLG